MKRKLFLMTLIGLLVLSVGFVSCHKEGTDDGTNNNNNNTGTIKVYNKYSASKPHNIYSIRIYKSGGFDKWDFKHIYRNQSNTISNIPAGTYTVQAEYVKGHYTKKSGIRVQKGKTTEVTFP